MNHKTIHADSLDALSNKFLEVIIIFNTHRIKRHLSHLRCMHLMKTSKYLFDRATSRFRTINLAVSISI